MFSSWTFLGLALRLALTLKVSIENCSNLESLLNKELLGRFKLVGGRF